MVSMSEKFGSHVEINKSSVVIEKKKKFDDHGNTK